jgi:CheY-like chemotaxis protein
LIAKPRVLVVDDHAANRYAFETVLEQEFEVWLAESGHQALELCQREDFSVIVLDVRMPVMDGFDTAEALRQRERTRVTPIVFTSAYEQTSAQMSRGYVSGATDFLFSPVDPDLLRLKVATYAQIHLRHEALRRNVERLNEELRDLHAELARRGVAVTRVAARLDRIEEAARELRERAFNSP